MQEKCCDFAKETLRIFNSYSSRTRRIWADLYNQRGRRPSWLLSAHIYPASPRRITVLVNFQAILLIFLRWNLLNLWLFLYRRRREKIFSDLQTFSTRNSPSVFPYLVNVNDNGSYHGLRKPIRKLENRYPELNIYLKLLILPPRPSRTGSLIAHCS